MSTETAEARKGREVLEAAKREIKELEIRDYALYQGRVAGLSEASEILAKYAYDQDDSPIGDVIKGVMITTSGLLQLAAEIIKKETNPT